MKFYIKDCDQIRSFLFYTLRLQFTVTQIS